MIKTIKLEESVYNRLDAIRGKRETFSEVVARLLFIRDQFANLSDNLAPTLHPGKQESIKDPVGAAMNG